MACVSTTPQCHNSVLIVHLNCHVALVPIYAYYRIYTFTGDEGPSKVHNIYVQYQDLMQNFQQADNDVANLRQSLVSSENLVFVLMGCF